MIRIFSKFVLLISVGFFISCSSNNEWSKINYEKDLSDPFFDEQTCGYPWYIICDDDGEFHSIISDTITANDTVPLHHTAKCVSSHQGEHEMDYCIAHKKGDSLFLHFPSPLPAFWLDMNIVIADNKFKADAFGYPFEPISLKWQTTKQKLVLQYNNYAIGDTLKGRCYIEFDEIYSDSDRYKFYFTGVFKTVIEGFSTPTL